MKNKRRNEILIFASLSIVLLIAIQIATPKLPHIVILINVGLMFFGRERQKLISRIFFPLTLNMLLFDLIQRFPNYGFRDVISEKLYLFEKQYFGFNGKTLNELSVEIYSPFLDILFGVIYLIWFLLPLFFAIYLIRKNKLRVLKIFTTNFITSNILGFLCYYIIPAAPPWYYEKYGDEIIKGITGDPARFSEFDRILNVGVYDLLYTMNKNIYGAMPSLHCAIPFVCFFSSLFMKGNMRIKFILFLISILTCLAALYSSHHYFIDILVAVILVWIVHLISVLKIKLYKK